MHLWHRETLDRAIAHYAADPSTRAIILGGSVAKGLERPDSDIDLLVIVTAEEYARRQAEAWFVEIRYDLSTYEGGYIDAKFHDEAFLSDAAERGSEPTRNAFVNAKLVWGGWPGLADLLGKIATYPVEEQASKMNRFWAQLCLQRYFIGQAFKHDDHLMQVRTASEVVFWSARMLLAHNQVLFPSPARMMQKVAQLPSIPFDYLALCDNLLTTPSWEAVEAVVESVTRHLSWNTDWAPALVQYTLDVELAWRTGHARLEDL
jgi:predicted nucleotidyltransferase